MSLEALGEDETETETFLHSLNPARKNTLVKRNLQYVLSALDGLGEMDGLEECKGEEYKSESKHSDYYSESLKHDTNGRHNSNSHFKKSNATSKKHIFEEHEKNFAQIMGNTSRGYEPGSDDGSGTGRYSRSLRSLSEGEEKKEMEMDVDDYKTGNRSNKFRK
jgi:hypothetical protein